jgi:dihydrofolate synthase/folylpolyglutamate synthase
MSRAIQLSTETARDAAVDWLLGRINYERTAEIPYNERQLKLDRMRQLLTRLGQPDAGMKIVHVAGTKGKGSTSALIAGVLTAAGFRTGLFTSPHLERIEERFAVDGEPCTSAELVALVDRLRPIVAAMDGEATVAERGSAPFFGREGVSPLFPRAEKGDRPRRIGTDPEGPTFFEIVTAIALMHFVERQVDAAVLEVGLGGRLDSTNVCLPAVSVITSISYDHTKQLGHTLAAIAREKAGIIKPGVPVVSGVTDPEPRAVIAEVTREHGCRLVQIERDFEFDYCGSEVRTMGFSFAVPSQEFELSAVPLAMRGSHQAANAAVALAAIAELRHQGWCISTDAMRLGLSRTKIAGRVEFLASEPAVVLDVCHNTASARALVDALAEIPTPSRRTLILSISRDKDVRAIAAELVPHFDRVIVTQYQNNPRAFPSRELSDIVRDVCQVCGSSPADHEITIRESPESAWSHARATALPRELVCIAGSFFLAAEMKSLLGR